MTIEFVNILGTVASALVGNTGSKQKEGATPVVPVFGPEAALVTENNNNEKVETNMTKENAVVETVVAEAVSVKAEGQSIFGKVFASMNERAKSAGNSAKAALEEAKDNVASDSKEAKKEGFFAKAKAFTGKVFSAAGGFIKKHGFKSTMGLVALTVAGTVTSSLGGALFVGTVLYTVTDLAIKLIKAKRAKAAVDHSELVLGALGNALLYGTVGAMAMMCLSGILVGLLIDTAVYSYIGYSYMAYFIVA